MHDCPIIQQLILKHRGQNLKERAVLANMLILFIFPHIGSHLTHCTQCACVFGERKINKMWFSRAFVED